MLWPAEYRVSLGTIAVSINIFARSGELDVAAFLTDLLKAGAFKATFDFAKRKGLKPPQSQPLSIERPELELGLVARMKLYRFS